jgi:hypothetical protein
LARSKGQAASSCLHPVRSMHSPYPDRARGVQVLEERLLPASLRMQCSTLRAHLKERLWREGAGSAAPAAAAAAACGGYAFRVLCAHEAAFVERLRRLQRPGLLAQLQGCRWAFVAERHGVCVQLGTARAHLTRAQVCPTCRHARGLSGSRALPPHRPREDGLAHPADTSRTNLASASASDVALSKP